jgi:hypothetical protein
MRNPEELIVENITADEIIKQIYEKVKENPFRQPIDLEQFRDLYGEEIINRDLEYVRRLEEKFAQESQSGSQQERIHRLATIFENIFQEQAERNNWLGDNVYIIKASRFDDIKNGVDNIAEFQKEDRSASYLALAIDVTMSADVEKKLKRIKKGIENGHLATVKYFVSQYTNIRGEFSRIPHVVIGADIKTIKELAELWLQNDTEGLKNHYIQFQILEEILHQLIIFQKYAERAKQEELVRIYREMQNILQRISQEKISRVTNSRYAQQRDSVFYSFKKYLSNFQNL